MKDFIEKVKLTLINKLDTEDILLIDNSKLHTGHKFFDPHKFHLKLVVKSKKLKRMSKIEAHKMIFSILKDEMNLFYRFVICA